MNHFEQVGGILVAIRCLDEGVDIPLINKAVIVSSSQSEREFIQRRGRALRRAPGKNFAYLFDFLMETSDGEILNTKELERLLEFSRDAFNQEPYIRLMYMKEAALH
jgi:superfamily II DNA or RNA helicase